MYGSVRLKAERKDYRTGILKRLRGFLRRFLLAAEIQRIRQLVKKLPRLRQGQLHHALQNLRYLDPALRRNLDQHHTVKLRRLRKVRRERRRVDGKDARKVIGIDGVCLHVGQHRPHACHRAVELIFEHPLQLAEGPDAVCLIGAGKIP